MAASARKQRAAAKPGGGGDGGGDGGTDGGADWVGGHWGGHRPVTSLKREWRPIVFIVFFSSKQCLVENFQGKFQRNS